MTPIIVIAIDGPSASGKGTLARRLAEHLGYDYLDTGALYRAVGKAVLDTGKNPDNEEDALSAAQALSSTLDPVQLADPSLRTDDVGQAASKVARFAGVRQALLDFQRDFVSRPRIKYISKGVILDGRDIGTVICPTAPAKLFVTASTEERARRRHLELASKGLDVPYATVLKDMYERDARDSGRETAPLKPATDALILDTTDLNADQTLEKSLAFIQAKISTIDP